MTTPTQIDQLQDQDQDQDQLQVQRDDAPDAARIEARLDRAPIGPTVTVRYFAAAKAAVGRSEESISLAEGATVGDLIDTVGSSRVAVFARCSFIVNDRATTDRELLLAPGDRIDVLPPFAGG